MINGENKDDILGGNDIDSESDEDKTILTLTDNEKVTLAERVMRRTTVVTFW